MLGCGVVDSLPRGGIARGRGGVLAKRGKVAPQVRHRSTVHSIVACPNHLRLRNGVDGDMKMLVVLAGIDAVWMSYHETDVARHCHIWRCAEALTNCAPRKLLLLVLAQMHGKCTRRAHFFKNLCSDRRPIHGSLAKPPLLLPPSSHTAFRRSTPTPGLLTPMGCKCSVDRSRARSVRQAATRQLSWERYRSYPQASCGSYEPQCTPKV